ncbi:hypothetical protein JD844_002539 [Phrynosoma platyrhinos]|uniref:U1-type domain-containing protein n=1 Tax=Phrynosoma platyrhinos TaxID=52577 RepID=A0ABQ7TCG0_PHRPL|nr:hypothetical protein JD844_002539 [Phrynosoma platyrhinos]
MAASSVNLVVKKPLSKNIRSLKDFMKDPNREEPLIGLEYVLEVRFKGRRSPFYECQLCQFNTEMAPMIQHLTGQKHRKIYLKKHYPDKVKRNPNEDKEEKIQFFRRIARDVEKIEGLKMYKREGFERPSEPSASAKKKASLIFLQNDPVLREKAMEYMKDFEITSDKEAALVISIAQSLSEALKDFCEKKATLNHIKSLPSLMKQGMQNAKQHKSNKPSEYYQNHPGILNHLQEHIQLHRCLQAPGPTPESTIDLDAFSTEAIRLTRIIDTMALEVAFSSLHYSNCFSPLGDSWNHGFLTNGLAQLQSLIQSAPNTSSTPTNSYAYQMREKASSYGLNRKDLATVSALESSFALQPGGFGTGIEWMKQFNQSVSANFQFSTVKEKSPYLKTSQSSYPKHYQGDGSQVPSNRIAENRLSNSGSFRTSHDLRASSLTPISCPPPRTYQASYALQKRPSWYHDGPGSGSQMPASSFSSESSGHDWAQADYPKPDFDDDLASYTSFPDGSLHQQQNTQVYNNAGCESKSNLTADVMSQLQGKDAATLANMIQQLLPYYPDLQSKCMKYFIFKS